MKHEEWVSLLQKLASTDVVLLQQGLDIFKNSVEREGAAVLTEYVKKSSKCVELKNALRSISNCNPVMKEPLLLKFFMLIASVYRASLARPENESCESVCHFLMYYTFVANSHLLHLLMAPNVINYRYMINFIHAILGYLTGIKEDTLAMAWLTKIQFGGRKWEAFWQQFPRIMEEQQKSGQDTHDNEKKIKSMTKELSGIAYMLLRLWISYHVHSNRMLLYDIITKIPSFWQAVLTYGDKFLNSRTVELM
ncbi:hypothetical protein RFI_37665, partial [Reticulomyxa filosa]